MSKSLRPERTIIDLPIEDLTPNPRNARRHPKKQLRQLGNSIERFGFINPVYINDDGVILSGHGRVDLDLRTCIQLPDEVALDP